MDNSTKMKVRAGNSVYEVEYSKKENIVDIRIDDRSYIVDVSSIGSDLCSLLVDGRSIDAMVSRQDNRFTVGFKGNELDVEFFDPRARKAAGDASKSVAEGIQHIKAPMAGRIVSVLVKKGDRVQEGQGLIILEAMKMENKLVSQGEGVVVDVLASDKETVESGRNLMILEMGKAAGA